MTSNIKQIPKEHCEVLIIGSGLAGLYAALYASKYKDVILLTKSSIVASNSYWAQGGIAAAIDPQDSILFHYEDTIKAGRGICNNEAVKILVSEGRDRVGDLIELGMEFDMDESGLDLALEGGHSKRRILHAGGSSTGKIIVDFLISYVESKPNIRILEHNSLIELISDGNRCYGAVIVDEQIRKPKIFTSDSTILAVGGASSIYQRTTNPPAAVGDGIAISWNAGAQLTDMEFIQFHPTATYIEGTESFLISETLRGEGAYLLNKDGRRFMPDYHQLAELAPRDIVSRSLHKEISSSDVKYVYLTVTHLDPDFIKNRFPSIYQKCMNAGIDITKEPIPVAPAAHYSIGGVKTGLMAETSLKGLFACGEAACTGVHGANRLASNSLLECIVFGKRAVDGAVDTSTETVDVLGLIDETNASEINLPENELESYLHLKAKVSHLMNDHVGTVRSDEGLKTAISKLDEISRLTTKVSGSYRRKLKYLLTICGLITKAALMRTESRGAHIRDKYPEDSDSWKAHIIWS